MDIKQIIVSVAIAIVFTMFVAYGVETFYPSPDYENFCPDTWNIENEQECLDINGTWETETDYEGRIENHCENKTGCEELYDIADDISKGSNRNYTLNHLVERVKIYNEENFDYEFIDVRIK